VELIYIIYTHDVLHTHHTHTRATRSLTVLLSLAGRFSRSSLFRRYTNILLLSLRVRGECTTCAFLCKRAKYYVSHCIVVVSTQPIPVHFALSVTNANSKSSHFAEIRFVICRRTTAAAVACSRLSADSRVVFDLHRRFVNTVTINKVYTTKTIYSIL